MVGQLKIALTLAFAALLLIARPVAAAEVRTAGKLNGPKDATVAAISTDPVVQNILNEDLRIAQRGRQTTREVTLTVNVTQKLLKPGVSLADVAPGDPAVADLLRDAGAQPLPLGDTGSDKNIDPYDVEARRQATTPDDPVMSQFRSYMATRNAMGERAGASPYDKMADQIYDTAIVARASLGGSASEYTVVAVVHAGDDLRTAKKLVAEEIANAVLH
jgi:hypothetical protein